MRSTGRFVTRTLMCRDHEVAAFTYDVGVGAVVGRIRKMDTAWAPLGSLDRTLAMTSARLSAWLSSRAVPMSRAGAAALVGALGLSSTEELMLIGLGLSLSDQYWLRPDGFDGGWADVSLFSRPFSREVGTALVAHDEGSRAAAVRAIRADEVVVSSSPDVALNGNLPKFWEHDGADPRLHKAGSAQCLFLEPYCEAVATDLCERVAGDGGYVPYRLEEPRAGDATRWCSCPDMVDDRHEFVPAWEVMGVTRRDNSESMHDAYVRTLEEHGIADASADVERMLVVDHLIGNFDRHWGNFGVIIDTESRMWVRSAPLFDMGSSLWCDRAAYPGSVASPRRLAHATPFLHRPELQLGRYARDLGWLDMGRLDGFAERAAETLALDPLTRGVPGYLRAVRDEVERRAEGLLRLQDELDARRDPATPLHLPERATREER